MMRCTPRHVKYNEAMTASANKSFSVTLSIDSPAEAERVFQALSPGATINMPIQETFWARRFGMLVDRFGTPWMINCEKPHG